MFRRLNPRIFHPVLLVLVGAALTFPNLGRPSLWDIDEGNNAEAAREMYESGNWVVPTFNYQLRPDKPALLYWLQMAGYRTFGIGEFGARLPSALAALATVLITYWLGCVLFGQTAGFFSGLVLASAVFFCASAHFANPDALLSCFSTLTLLLFWQSLTRPGRIWYLASGASAGLAVLAKGPVGVALPIAVMGTFLLWSRRLGYLRNWKLLWSLLAFFLVATPWYAWVGAETRGEFLREFIFRHNTGRFLGTLEGHGGHLYYYLLVVAIGFAPWSAFLGLAAWCALRKKPEPTENVIRDADRFLCCWSLAYFVFFSLSATKLPNYILPIYPALAVLTGRFLDSWLRSAQVPPRWALGGTLALLSLIGVGLGAGLLVAGGTIDLSMMKGRRLPGVEGGLWLALLPIVGSGVAAVMLMQKRVRGVVAAVSVTAVVFVGAMATWGGMLIDGYKAPRELASTYRRVEPAEETRVASYKYDQPSLVFYCQREVQRLPDESKALEFMRYPIPIYLFVPEPVWDELKDKVAGPHRLLERRYDFYRRYDVLLVTNR